MPLGGPRPGRGSVSRVALFVAVGALVVVGFMIWGHQWLWLPVVAAMVVVTLRHDQRVDSGARRLPSARWRRVFPDRSAARWQRGTITATRGRLWLQPAGSGEPQLVWVTGLEDPPHPPRWRRSSRVLRSRRFVADGPHGRFELVLHPDAVPRLRAALGLDAQ